MDLVIIEAPGKRNLLQEIISTLPGFSPLVRATKGVLFNLPDDHLALSPDTLTPSHLVPVHPEIVNDLRKQIREADTLWIATDPDLEGEMIAAQVMLLATNFRGTVHRVRFDSLHPDTVRAAFSRPGVIDQRQASLAIARRAIDRFIGYLYSDRLVNNQAGIVGRVHTRLLQALDRNPPPCIECDGFLANRWRVTGRASAGAKDDLKEIVRQLTGHPDELLRDLPVVSGRIRVPPPPPMNYADLIIAASRELAMPPETTDRSMQSLYEQGRLSYPRTMSRVIGPAGRRAAERLAVAQALHLADAMAGENGKHAHEALYPTQDNLDLAGDPRDLNEIDALLVLAGRQLVAANMKEAIVNRSEYENSALMNRLKHLGFQTKGLSLSIVRERPVQAGWKRLFGPSRASLTIRQRPVAEQIVERMDSVGIGRPSTYVNHALSVVRRKQVLPDGSLSVAGRHALEYASENTPWLLGPTDAVEQIIDHPPESDSAEEIVVRMLEGFGLSAQEAAARIRRHLPEESPALATEQLHNSGQRYNV